MPFPEETFCLKSAKESKELEQEVEPSYTPSEARGPWDVLGAGPVAEGLGAHGKRHSIFHFHAHRLAHGFARIPLNRGQSLLTAQATSCPASRLLRVLSFEVTEMSCGSEDHR